MEETYVRTTDAIHHPTHLPHRMYDRSVKPVPERPYKGFSYRMHTLLGTTGMKMAKYRASKWDAISSPFRVVWRPHLLMALVYEVRVQKPASLRGLWLIISLQGVLFGFSIGINVGAYSGWVS